MLANFDVNLGGISRNGCFHSLVIADWSRLGWVGEISRSEKLIPASWCGVGKGMREGYRDSFSHQMEVW
jgi:hypothetical protein